MRMIKTEVSVWKTIPKLLSSFSFFSSIYRALRRAAALLTSYQHGEDMAERQPLHHQTRKELSDWRVG
jgi:hypothetical protein